jgi:hypothetical protein
MITCKLVKNTETCNVGAMRCALYNKNTQSALIICVHVGINTNTVIMALRCNPKTRKRWFTTVFRVRMTSESIVHTYATCKIQRTQKHFFPQSKPYKNGRDRRGGDPPGLRLDLEIVLQVKPNKPETQKPYHARRLNSENQPSSRMSNVSSRTIPIETAHT